MRLVVAPAHPGSIDRNEENESTALGSTLAQVGNERASNTRQRERGQICYRCGAELDPLPAWTRGERACEGCTPRPHQVLMNFMRRESWSVHFIAEGCRTPISGYFDLEGS